MMEFLFLDLDDTILDFHKAERLAISRTFRSFGLEPTEQVLERYHVINRLHWERLERGELTRDQVLTGRFQMLFEELGIPAKPQAIAKGYEHNLGLGHYFLPGAKEALDTLRGKYRLFLASNGTASVQHSRLTSAGLYPYFEEVFVSQALGANKPSRAFFDACAARIPGYDPRKALMVGDSLTSDILGGINAGMKTCWVCPRGAQGRPDIVPDYRIEALSQLPELLKTL
ncbi:MAG: YjjG family noncanonical pyrimidine nucleotidase [Candidatus Faecousia sp.]|nr:YjjG family noncanonical pyrimidine nucleotidase [Candidatus Faecousia sp.]